MLRLVISTSAAHVTVDLDGKLVGPWVDEVHRIVAELRAEQRVCLNLRHLRYADAAGVGLLCAFRNDGIEFIGVPPLIAGMLESRRGLERAPRFIVDGRAAGFFFVGRNHSRRIPVLCSDTIISKTEVARMNNSNADLPDDANARADAPLTPEERYNRIAEAAYLRAAARRFEGGDPMQDWLDAEADLIRAGARDPSDPAP